MASSYESIEAFLMDEVSALADLSREQVSPATVLVGPGRVMDSADLVMLLLSAEDYAREKLGTHFDWSSDSAMSAARSVLRSIGSLARHLDELQPA